MHYIGIDHHRQYSHITLLDEKGFLFCVYGKSLAILLNFHPPTSWNEHIPGKEIRSRIKQINKTTKKAKKKASK
jgi:hypothetical protein